MVKLVGICNFRCCLLQHGGGVWTPQEIQRSLVALSESILLRRLSSGQQLQVAVISVPWEFPNTEARDSCLQELGEECWPWTTNTTHLLGSQAVHQSNRTCGAAFFASYLRHPLSKQIQACVDQLTQRSGSTHKELSVDVWIPLCVDGSKNLSGRSRRRSQPKCFTSGSLRSWYRNIRGNKQMLFVEFLELMASVASLVSIVSRFWAGLEMNDREKLHVCRESSSTKSQ